MSQIYATTQKLALVAVPEKGDKMRVTSLSWDDFCCHRVAMKAFHRRAVIMLGR